MELLVTTRQYLVNNVLKNPANIYRNNTGKPKKNKNLKRLYANISKALQLPLKAQTTGKYQGITVSTIEIYT